MDDGKIISVVCPNCGQSVDLRMTELIDRLRPRCPSCRRGITIDRAWMLVEIARLQALLRHLGQAAPRIARPGNQGE